MKTSYQSILGIALIISFLLSCSATEIKFNTKLEPSLSDCLIGYIDQDSSWIIEPKYHAAQEFSEGLAPVRENGFYGYIDQNGNYAIEPTFDYATPFKNGVAKVYNGRLPIVIDHKGVQQFVTQFPYNELQITCKGKGVIYKERKYSPRYTTSYTVVNKSGKSIHLEPNEKITNIYGEIYRIKSTNRARVVKTIYLNNDFKQLKHLERAKRIQNAGEGYAIVTWLQDGPEEELNHFKRKSILNKKGAVVAHIDTLLLDNKRIIINFSDGIAFVAGTEQSSDGLKTFYRLTTTGRTSVLADNYLRVSQLKKGIALGWVSDTLAYLIDNSGQRIGIDEKLNRVGNNWIYSGNLSTFEYSTYTWTNQTDASIKLQQERRKKECANIDFQSIRKYNVRSVPFGNPDKLYKVSRNTYKNDRIDSVYHDTTGYVFLKQDAMPDAKGVQVFQTSNKSNSAFYIANCSKDTVMFSTLGGSLICALEIKGPTGKWHPIEIGPQLLCGNSYGYALLPPECAWIVHTPTYSGENTTETRLSVRSYSSDPDPNLYGSSLALNQGYTFSKTFSIKLNPGQLWRQF